MSKFYYVSTNGFDAVYTSNDGFSAYDEPGSLLRYIVSFDDGDDPTDYITITDADNAELWDDVRRLKREIWSADEERRSAAATEYIKKIIAECPRDVSWESCRSSIDDVLSNLSEWYVAVEA